MVKLLGHGRTFVDDVLDVLQRSLDSLGPRQLATVRASGSADSAGIALARPARQVGVWRAVAGVHDDVSWRNQASGKSQPTG
jgi:hypothetical protein